MRISEFCSAHAGYEDVVLICEAIDKTQTAQSELKRSIQLTEGFLNPGAIIKSVGVILQVGENMSLQFSCRKERQKYTKSAPMILQGLKLTGTTGLRRSTAAENGLT